MVEQIYFMLSYFSTGITFAFGLCFLFINMPQIPALKSYKKARLIMAIAYISLSAFNAIGEMSHSSTSSTDMDIEQSLTAIGAMIQAFLYTYTFIILVNPRFVKKKRILREAILIFLTSSLLCFALFGKEKQLLYMPVFYAFIIYYSFMLVYYTILFLKNYRHYIYQVNNFFSEQESARLRWIYYSFFGALFIGISALAITFSDNMLHYILFIFFSIAFYCYFGIKFIEYAFRFKLIETLVVEKGRKEENRNNRLSYFHLEEQLKKWMEEKGFTTQRITIEQLSQELGTNRTYLSDYINSYYKQTFSEWINTLRIEEAKCILANKTDLSIGEVGENVGYTDKSNFGRQFIKRAGISPNNWRKSQNPVTK
jgi:AraC-like DNA-binding protein